VTGVLKALEENVDTRIWALVAGAVLVGFGVLFIEAYSASCVNASGVSN
jgi:hypothetical protein